MDLIHPQQSTFGEAQKGMSTDNDSNVNRINVHNRE